MSGFSLSPAFSFGLGSAQLSGAGGGGGGEFDVTFSGMAVTFEADDVTYSPDLWLFGGQRVTFQGDGVTL